MSVIALALSVAMQSAPDAVTLAHDLCVVSAGNFATFDRLADEAGSTDLPQDRIDSIFPEEPRGRGETLGRRVGDVDIVLADLPAGRRSVPAPIQTVGQPTVMWDYTFPHTVICRIRAKSLPSLWPETVGGWMVMGSSLSVLAVGNPEIKSWTYGQDGFVLIQTPKGDDAQINIAFPAGT